MKRRRQFQREQNKLGDERDSEDLRIEYDAPSKQGSRLRRRRTTSTTDTRMLNAIKEADGNISTAIENTTASAKVVSGQRTQQALMIDPDLLSKDTTNSEGLATKTISDSATHRRHFEGYYPVTTLLLLFIHGLYLFQWSQKRRRRRRSSFPNKPLTYRTVVQRKQYYKWWTVFLSQYRTNTVRSSDSAAHQQENIDSLDIERGGAPQSDNANHQQHQPSAGIIASSVALAHTYISTTITRFIPESWLQSAAAERIRMYAGITKYYVVIILTFAGGQSFCMLFYNTHLIWSCRALEGHYGRINSGEGTAQSSNYSYLQYVRVIMSLAIAATILELMVSGYVLRLLAPPLLRSPPLARDENDEVPTTSSSGHILTQDVGTATSSFNSPAVHRFRKRLRSRNMGTPSLTMLSAALLLIFRFEFPYVAIPVLPFVSLSRWLPAGVSYVFAMILLHYASSSQNVNKKMQQPAWAATICGTIIGFLWGTGLLDFCAQAYYGNAVVFMALLLTALSVKARNPAGATMLCFNHVGWNSRGKMLLYDDHLNRWVEVADEDPVAISGTRAADDDDDNMDDSPESSDTEELDEVSERAFPPTEDEAIYGRLPSINMEIASDDENNETTELTPLTSTTNNASSRVPNHQLRSRRA